MLKQKKYKVIFLISLILILITISFYINTSKNKSTKSTETIVLNEVVHSVFYAPQYVALSNGYFEENGLNVHLITGNGADKSMTSLLTGESHIILAGVESSMYIQSNEDAKEVINIAQLTKRAGNFLLARDDVDTFQWSNVKGKTIIGGRPGGMPQIVLESILKENGIDPVNDVNIVTNLDFTATSGAFATGDYDYTVEFEPNATKLETDGYGKVVASLGVDGGEIPYTSYIVTKEYAEENEEVLVKFLDAIEEGQKFVENNTSLVVAESISPYFDTIPIEQLTIIIDRYKNQDTWNIDMYCNIESYKRLEDLLIDAKTLNTTNDLETLIDNSYIGGE